MAASCRCPRQSHGYSRQRRASAHWPTQAEVGKEDGSPARSLGFSDDGDELSVVNLRIGSQGCLGAGVPAATTPLPIGTAPLLHYQVSDGQLLWQNPATTDGATVERADFEGEYKAVANGLNRKGVS